MKIFKFVSRIPFLMCVSTLLFSLQAQAGIVLNGIRVVYHAQQSEATLAVKNTDATQPYLVQSWVDEKGLRPDDELSRKIPFIVTPPLFRLDSKNENLLRIIHNGEALPQDRESVYWLNVKAIPTLSEEDNNHVLHFSVKNRIKLFYRPQSLTDKEAKQAYEKLTFQREGQTLVINNPTPFYVTFHSLSYGDKPIDTKGKMVPPFGESRYPLPQQNSLATLNWQTINDYGGLTPLKSKSLQ